MKKNFTQTQWRTSLKDNEEELHSHNEEELHSKTMKNFTQTQWRRTSLKHNEEELHSNTMKKNFTQTQDMAPPSERLPLVLRSLRSPILFRLLGTRCRRSLILWGESVAQSKSASSRTPRLSTIERGHQMDGWPLCARFWLHSETSPESHFVQTTNVIRIIL